MPLNSLGLLGECGSPLRDLADRLVAFRTTGSPGWSQLD